MSVRRIAVTGGPGAGKTTVWQALSQRHPDQVVAVPEVATSLFAHVFPPVQNEVERLLVQRSIFTVQHSLEAIHESRALPGQTLLCDRGSPDGGGYWPDGHEAFFAAMQTRLEDELSRYAAVVFLETAAAKSLSIDHGNPTRTEDLKTAVEIDRRLVAVWSNHPRFTHIPCQQDFSDKVELATSALSKLVDAST